MSLHLLMVDRKEGTWNEVYLPIGVICDDGREDFPLMEVVVCGHEVEDDPVAAVRLDAVLQLLVVQTE